LVTAAPSILKQIIEQLTHPIVLLLLGTAVVSGTTGEVLVLAELFVLALILPVAEELTKLVNRKTSSRN